MVGCLGRIGEILGRLVSIMETMGTDLVVADYGVLVSYENRKASTEVQRLSVFAVQ